MNTLTGRTAVITGASRGLGEAMALGLAAEGAAVVLGARSVDDLGRVAEACLAAGAPAATPVHTDVADEGSVDGLVQTALVEHGAFDVFVANAATSNANVAPGRRFSELTSFDADVARTLFEVNGYGMWLQLRAALRDITPGGSVITVGSSTGRNPRAGAGLYAVTKSTVDILTAIAAREVAEQGTRVNCLTPGAMVDTQLFGPDGMPEWLKERFGALEPDVMVPAAVWLASDDSRDVSGAFVVAKDFNEVGADAYRDQLDTQLPSVASA